ncbi:MAG: Unknown protein, partial [uncultured Sulfurovum sp.]
FFDGDLHQLIQTLTVVTEQLKTDYKAKTFPNSSKKAMVQLAQKLKGSAFEDDFKKIINFLESILEDGFKEKKGTWVFAKKAYEKKFGRFIKMVDELLASSLGKGFIALDQDLDISIKIDQNITLNTLKEYFTYISISIIKS